MKLMTPQVFATISLFMQAMLPLKTYRQGIEAFNRNAQTKGRPLMKAAAMAAAWQKAATI